MGTGYTRNDTANNIADGNVINASDLDGEFDAIQSAFNATTGHSHDGTTGEGPQIGTGGIADTAVTTAKIADLNVTTGKIANDAVTLGTKTSGNYVAAGAVSGVGLSGSASAEGATFTVTSNATSANTASTIVARDASGNFSAGTITAALTGNVTGNVTGSSGSTTGNAATATALQTARTIAGQSFDGTANITIASTDLSDSGSINAATLDSLDSTQFLRSDAADTKTAGDLSFSDNVKAQFGAGNDLQIYHDALNSYITDAGTGSLRINGNNLELSNANYTANYLVANNGANVQLYYNGGVKITTTSSGIDVTGNITVSGTVDGRDVASDGSKLDGIESGATADQSASEILTAIKTVDGSGSGLDADTLDGVDSGSFLRSDAADTKTSGDLTFSDNVKAIFGDGSDLQIYHTSTDSRIVDAGTGNLTVQATNFVVNNTADTQNMIIANDGGAVSLYYAGGTRFTTTSGGVDVTGSLTFDGGTTSADLNFDDNAKAVFGGGSDLKIYHDGLNSYIQDSGTGDLKLYATNYGLYNATGSAVYMTATNGAAVDLRYNNLSKLTTTSTGISVTGDVTSSSDENLKENIQPITDALAKVQQINGVSFDWKDSGRSSIGVIAQNIEKVIPEVVTENDEGFKSVAYGNVVGLLIEAVKELTAEVEELKKR